MCPWHCSSWFLLFYLFCTCRYWFCFNEIDQWWSNLFTNLLWMPSQTSLGSAWEDCSNLDECFIKNERGSGDRQSIRMGLGNVSIKFFSAFIYSLQHVIPINFSFPFIFAGMHMLLLVHCTVCAIVSVKILWFRCWEVLSLDTDRSSHSGVMAVFFT